MQVIKQSSLEDQISKKTFLWVFILVVIITTMVCIVSFFTLQQMFIKQVNTWQTVAPQQALISLIDSDDYSIQREMKFLESTGLFSAGHIINNQKRVIASFGKEGFNADRLISIQDNAKITWGYYYLQANFYHFFAPFLISIVFILVFIIALYFLIRWRIRHNLETSFSHFNHFLSEMELLTEKIQDIANEENPLAFNTVVSFSTEQVMINRAVSKLLEEIRKANRSLREAISIAEQKRFQDELTMTALQVVHDIGSPLAVLELIVKSAVLTLPEESRVMIRGAAEKMRDIANSLLKKSKGGALILNSSTLTQQSLSSLLTQTVTEKRLQYRDNTSVNISYDANPSSLGLFAMLKVDEFSRILSNIINNAVESMRLTSVEIVISLLDGLDKTIIQIKDNGKGIPNEIIAQLGKMGVTYGKENGHGLGLFHAKTTIENWGGFIDIQSQEGEGSTVQLHLPKTKSPNWFVPEISIIDNQTIVIIDDDESIHALWQNRFQLIQNTNKISVKLLHFYSSKDLQIWVEAEGEKPVNIFYLCDYEYIGANQNGIDLITSLQLTYQSILVTNRFHQEEVITACELSGLKLLPKEIAGIVPITVTEH